MNEPRLYIDLRSGNDYEAHSFPLSVVRAGADDEQYRRFVVKTLGLPGRYLDSYYVVRLKGNVWLSLVCPYVIHPDEYTLYMGGWGQPCVIYGADGACEVKHTWDKSEVRYGPCRDTVSSNYSEEQL